MLGGGIYIEGIYAGRGEVLVVGGQEYNLHLKCGLLKEEYL